MWPSIDPGKLRHQIVILKENTTADSSGATASWIPFIYTYASIEPMRGTDVVKAGQDTTQLFLTVSINYQSGILPNMRVKAPNGTYIIQAIENVQEMNTVLKFTCLGLGPNE